MTKTIRTAWVQSIAIVLILAAAALPASAQITTGNITGTVKDAQGGVVPGATVTLIDEARGTKLAPAFTDATGSYTFQTLSDDGVRLWVNGTQVINNWTGHAPTVDTSAAIRRPPRSTSVTAFPSGSATVRPSAST